MSVWRFHSLIAIKSNGFPIAISPDIILYQSLQLFTLWHHEIVKCDWLAIKKGVILYRCFDCIAKGSHCAMWYL